MRQRTMLLNAVRGHLAEFAIIPPQGPPKVMEVIANLRETEAPGLPEIARSAVLSLGLQPDALASEIHALECQRLARHRQDTASQRLETIAGAGMIAATALAASLPDPFVFRPGRRFAAFLGLSPEAQLVWRQDRLGRISKMGDGWLRRLLLVGATSVICRAETSPSETGAGHHGSRWPTSPHGSHGP